MADRGRATRGRKRTFGKGHPPPSAADLFDSLIQGQDKAANDEPKIKKVKRISSSKSLAIKEGEPDVSSGPEGGDVSVVPWQHSQNSQESPGDNSNRSPLGGSDDSEGSDDDGPCVLMSFGGTLDKDSAASLDQSPRKPQRGRRPKTDSTAESGRQISDAPRIEVVNEPTTHDNGEGHENHFEEQDDRDIAGDPIPPGVDDDDDNDNADGDTAAEPANASVRRSSDNGGVGSLGVSKDVEDSIRKEIENMLANNRFRGGAGRGEGGGGDREIGDLNGDVSVSLEEDVILVEAGRKKHCRFLIRRQEDQTPPSSRNYRCFKCSFNTTRMNNMIRHYRQC